MRKALSAAGARLKRIDDFMRVAAILAPRAPAARSSQRVRLEGRVRSFGLAKTAFDDHPPCDVLVTDDGDCVMVRALVGERRGFSYEVGSYETVRH